jgi:hypothetical protein
MVIARRKKKDRTVEMFLNLPSLYLYVVQFGSITRSPGQSWLMSFCTEFVINLYSIGVT